MISFNPHSALRTPHSKRRGGTYIIVVGSALVVSSLGMMAILQQRVQRKSFEAAANMEQARLNAESAMRLGLLQIEQDPNWRSAAAANGGEVLTLTSADFGNVVLEAIDPYDGDLADDADDAVVLRADSDVGATSQFAERLVHPTRLAPEALYKGIVAGDDMTATGATVHSERPLSCDTSTLASANLYADMEAVGTSGSTYLGAQTLVLDKDRPPLPVMNALVAEYTSRGTAINISSLPITSPNLIRNSNMETSGGGSTAAHWSSSPSPDTCVVERSSDEDHSGIYSIKVTNRSNSSAGPIQDCTEWVKPNAMYELEAWIYDPSLLDTTEFRFSWHTQAAGGGGQTLVGGLLQVLLDVVGDLLGLWQWKDLSTTMQAGSWTGDVQSSYIKIETVSGTANFYVDDFTIREVNKRFLYRQVLSPNANPFGSTNSEGIYVIDCGGASLLIERCRIVGTLVILNPGAGSLIAGPVSWEPARPGYPALIVGSTNASYPADMRISTSRRGLNEALNSTNFNPAGTPHRGISTDADLNDILPSEIRGWVYAGRTLTIDNAATIHGVVMAGDDIHFQGAPQVFWDPAPIHHTPPGLEGTLELKARAGASKKAVQ